MLSNEFGEKEKENRLSIMKIVGCEALKNGIIFAINFISQWRHNHLIKHAKIKLITYQKIKILLCWAMSLVKKKRKIG